MNSDEQDIRAIAQIRQGDRDAYSDIVKKYKGLIYNLVIKITGNLSEAEDITQDVFVQIYKNLNRYDETKRFFPWMYTVALNVIRNKQNKKAPVILSSEQEALADQWLQHSETPEKTVSIAQQQMILARCILDLPMKQREAIVLRYYQGLAFEEIAEIQSCSVSAAKMRVYRCLEHLKNLMKDS